MSGARRSLPALAALLLLGSCSLITEFNPDRYNEDSEENCSDGLDNDDNGKSDCADQSCTHFDFCLENSAARCSDGLDNDVDTLIDCKDPQCCAHAKCYLEPSCGESTQMACTDGVDNDNNGLTDCADFSCKIPACCNQLRPVIIETFSSVTQGCTVAACPHETAACCQAKLSPCNAFDPQRWVAWGLPRPLNMGGRFIPNQPCSSCPASGIISAQDITLSPGLHLEYQYNLKADTAAQISVGLVEKAVVPQTDGPCGDVTTRFHLLLGVRLSGGKLWAVVGGVDQASISSIASGDQPVAVDIDPQGKIIFSHQAKAFFSTQLKAVTPYPITRLVLQGHSGVATLDNVVAGYHDRCDTPKQWLPGPTGPAPVLTPSNEVGLFDLSSVSSPSVMYDGSKYRLYYAGGSTASPAVRIGVATSTHGLVWARLPTPVTVAGETGLSQEAPSVLRLADGTWVMTYRTVDQTNLPVIALASSVDGVAWTRKVTAVRAGSAGSWDEVDVHEPTLVPFKAPADALPRLYLWYQGKGKLTSAGKNHLLPSLGLATATMVSDLSNLVFTKHKVKNEDKPVLEPKTGSSDDRGLGDPWVVIKDGKLQMYYVGFTWGGQTQINLAASEDGQRWVRYPDNPLVQAGVTSYFGSKTMRGPTVLSQWGALNLWYGGQNASGSMAIGHVVNRGAK